MTVRELLLARKHLLRAAENASESGNEYLVKTIIKMIVEINDLIDKVQAELPKNSPMTTEEFTRVPGEPPMIFQDKGRKLVIADEP